jgi:hypothetical protein
VLILIAILNAVMENGAARTQSSVMSEACTKGRLYSKKRAGFDALQNTVALLKTLPNRCATLICNRCGRLASRVVDAIVMPDLVGGNQIVGMR